MKRFAWASLAALAILSGHLLTAPAAHAATPPTAPPLRVMPLGDSITAGVGSTTGAGYRLPLWNTIAGQSRYTVDYVGSQSFGNVPDPDNEGHSGYRVADIRSGIDGWLSAATPDVVLLHIGINDLDRDPARDTQVSADRAAAAFTDLANRIFADRPGVTVLVQGLIPTTPNLEFAAQAYNADIKALQFGTLSGQKFRYLEPPALTSTEMNDGLHPNDAGYNRMAGVFFQGLDQAFTDGLAHRPAAHHAGTEAGTGRVRWADFDGDGSADYWIINPDGSVHVYLNKGTDGHGGWQDIGQVATGLTTDASRVRFADWDGDGRADYILIAGDGSVHVFLNKGGDGHGGWQDIGQVATGLTTDASRVRFADIDGDGRADYCVLDGNGGIHAYLNRGGDTSGGWVDDGQIASGLTGDLSRIRLADIDGDGKADYSVINPDGSVTTYQNNGGDGHGGWINYGHIATGLTTDQNAVVFADITGDGRADYLLTNSDGSVNAFVNNGGDGHGGWIDYGRIAAGA
ncbi:lysophospholipase L1-like esterase [Kitasatospora sp. GAS204A]|uniref:FG-GAP-like repeat-containing protein n=1 Tax=unclassified Kitasatospora TaxID=2633591 RepID=UPI002475ED86|nr:FG-GAP-like repeat-containing protein [Kitasatospora sp. GAS204B]MDH6123046.1 lysophospholipase L1-like esterase [Kitasatospora sp. GAS204B]